MPLFKIILNIVAANLRRITDGYCGPANIGEPLRGLRLLDFRGGLLDPARRKLDKGCERGMARRNCGPEMS
jgi:hypothetical protein